MNKVIYMLRKVQDKWEGLDEKLRMMTVASMLGYFLGLATAWLL